MTVFVQVVSETTEFLTEPVSLSSSQGSEWTRALPNEEGSQFSGTLGIIDKGGTDVAAEQHLKVQGYKAARI